MHKRERSAKNPERNMAWDALIWIICKLEDKWYVVINEIARPINGVVNNPRSSCVADGAGVRMRRLETAWRLSHRLGYQNAIFTQGSARIYIV